MLCEIYTDATNDELFAVGRFFAYDKEMLFLNHLPHTGTIAVYGVFK